LIDIVEVFRNFNYIISDELLSQTLHFFSEERAHVRNMMNNLNWDKSIIEQSEAVDFLAQNLLPCEYIYLVLPDEYITITVGDEIKCYKSCLGKAMWENAAKVIVKIGWPKIDPIIIPLFMWLIDPNWPGSQQIYNLILSLPTDVLLSKTNKIVNAPQNYNTYDYDDLLELINDILQEKKIGDQENRP